MKISIKLLALCFSVFSSTVAFAGTGYLQYPYLYSADGPFSLTQYDSVQTGYYIINQNLDDSTSVSIQWNTFSNKKVVSEYSFNPSSGWTSYETFSPATTKATFCLSGSHQNSSDYCATKFPHINSGMVYFRFKIEGMTNWIYIRPFKFRYQS